MICFRYLCLHNKATASICFEVYTQKHPSIDNGPPFSSPLLNFIWLLLIALEGQVVLIAIQCALYSQTNTDVVHWFLFIL